jgi:G3E family GTPase
MLHYSLHLRIGGKEGEKQLFAEARSRGLEYWQILLDRWGVAAHLQGKVISRKHARHFILSLSHAMERGPLNEERVTAALQETEAWFKAKKERRKSIANSEENRRIRSIKRQDKLRELERSGSQWHADHSESDFFARGSRSDGSFGARQ